MNSRSKLELLSPAGHWDALKAAVENGADAVYFGVEAHNARARAANFQQKALPEIMAALHAQGLRGYLTVNTLVFPSEVRDVCELVKDASKAGVDALIVQDIGIARLAREIAPDLPIHASTQMTVTSAAGIRAAKDLGCERVILARELSIEEIRKIHAEEPQMPLEVFVHGALCVAYSGQCLTSEALGGRSANRGECAQACRMPYELICDSEPVDLGNVDYLLSPQDLAAYDLIPQLVEAGVVSFKIEGRLKSAEYVANVTRHYRKAIDEFERGRNPEWTSEDRRNLELSFSRGLSHGFLDGNNHKVLVRGDFSNKRGPHVGFVEQLTDHSLIARLHAPVKAGDGLMIDVEDNNQGTTRGAGGRVYKIHNRSDQPRGSRKELGGRNSSPTEKHDRNPSIAGRVEIEFMRDSVDFLKVFPGQAIWLTNDQVLDQDLKESFTRGIRRKQALKVVVRAFVGERLILNAQTELGFNVRFESEEILKEALKRPADKSWVMEHFGKLGDTPFELSNLELETDGKTLLPASFLNQIRRNVVELLQDAIKKSGQERRTNHGALEKFEQEMQIQRGEATSSQTELTCLVRDMRQLHTMADLGVKTVYADFQDIREYKEACRIAQDAGISLWLATPRIEKPGEYNLFKYLEKCSPTGVLVRNAGGIEYCRKSGLRWIADFSLNITNASTARYFHELGAERLTAGFDLDISQLMGLLETCPANWFEVVIHQRVAMFHMEHCVFCMTLSPGTDKTNCGRPCDSHVVQLEDRVGARHRLMADVGCRNTLFNAMPQSAAEYIPRLKEKRVSGLRLEFVDEQPETVRDVVISYQGALSGGVDLRQLWKKVRATNQYGLTRGTLQIIS